MVCGIHGGNTEGYDRAAMLRNPDVWRRAQEFMLISVLKMLILFI